MIDRVLELPETHVLLQKRSPQPPRQVQGAIQLRGN